MKNLRTSLIAAAVLALAGSAHGHIMIFTTTLSGPAEAPPNPSPGTGFSTVTLDLDLITMRVQAQFSGLLGNVTASHIHGPTTIPFAGTAGVATPTPSFPGFPHGGTSGTYDMTFDMTLASSYNPAFITASGGTVGQAFNRLVFALENGQAYLNVHTNMFPGGEIRGFYIPAPGTAAMIGLGVLFAARRRRS